MNDSHKKARFWYLILKDHEAAFKGLETGLRVHENLLCFTAKLGSRTHHFIMRKEENKYELLIVRKKDNGTLIALSANAQEKAAAFFNDPSFDDEKISSFCKDLKNTQTYQSVKQWFDVNFGADFCETEFDKAFKQCDDDDELLEIFDSDKITARVEIFIKKMNAEEGSTQPETTPPTPEDRLASNFQIGYGNMELTQYVEHMRKLIDLFHNIDEVTSLDDICNSYNDYIEKHREWYKNAKLDSFMECFYRSIAVSHILQKERWKKSTDEEENFLNDDTSPLLNNAENGKYYFNEQLAYLMVTNRDVFFNEEGSDDDDIEDKRDLLVKMLATKPRLDNRKISAMLEFTSGNFTNVCECIVSTKFACGVYGGPCASWQYTKALDPDCLVQYLLGNPQTIMKMQDDSIHQVYAYLIFMRAEEETIAKFVNELKALNSTSHLLTILDKDVSIDTKHTMARDSESRSLLALYLLVASDDTSRFAKMALLIKQDGKDINKGFLNLVDFAHADGTILMNLTTQFTQFWNTSEQTYLFNNKIKMKANVNATQFRNNDVIFKQIQNYEENDVLFAKNSDNKRLYKNNSMRKDDRMLIREDETEVKCESDTAHEDEWKVWFPNGWRTYQYEVFFDDDLRVAYGVCGGGEINGISWKPFDFRLSLVGEQNILEGDVAKYMRLAFMTFNFRAIRNLSYRVLLMYETNFFEKEEDLNFFRKVKKHLERLRPPHQIKYTGKTDIETVRKSFFDKQDTFKSKKQNEVINQVLTANTSNIIGEALMGIGKTSFIIPYLLLNRLVKNNKSESFILVQPPHLTRTTLKNVIFVCDLLNIKVSLVTDAKEFQEKLTDTETSILVISDADLKAHFLASIRRDGQNFLKLHKNITVFCDEIDALIDPFTSRFNDATFQDGQAAKFPRNWCGDRGINEQMFFYDLLWLASMKTTHLYIESDETYYSFCVERGGKPCTARYIDGKDDDPQCVGSVIKGNSRDRVVVTRGEHGEDVYHGTYYYKTTKTNIFTQCSEKEERPSESEYVQYDPDTSEIDGFTIKPRQPIDRDYILYREKIYRREQTVEKEDLANLFRTGPSQYLYKYTEVKDDSGAQAFNKKLFPSLQAPSSQTKDRFMTCDSSMYVKKGIRIRNTAEKKTYQLEFFTPVQGLPKDPKVHWEYTEDHTKRSAAAWAVLSQDSNARIQHNAPQPNATPSEEFIAELKNIKIGDVVQTPDGNYVERLPPLHGFTEALQLATSNYETFVKQDGDESATDNHTNITVYAEKLLTNAFVYNRHFGDASDGHPDLMAKPFVHGQPVNDSDFSIFLLRAISTCQCKQHEIMERDRRLAQEVLMNAIQASGSHSEETYEKFGLPFKTLEEMKKSKLHEWQSDVFKYMYTTRILFPEKLREPNTVYSTTLLEVLFSCSNVIGFTGTVNEYVKTMCEHRDYCRLIEDQTTRDLIDRRLDRGTRSSLGRAFPQSRNKHIVVLDACSAMSEYNKTNKSLAPRLNSGNISILDDKDINTLSEGTALPDTDIYIPEKFTRGIDIDIDVSKYDIVVLVDAYTTKESASQALFRVRALTTDDSASYTFVNTTPEQPPPPFFNKKADHYDVDHFTSQIDHARTRADTSDIEMFKLNMAKEFENEMIKMLETRHHGAMTQKQKQQEQRRTAGKNNESVILKLTRFYPQRSVCTNKCTGWTQCVESDDLFKKYVEALIADDCSDDDDITKIPIALKNSSNTLGASESVYYTCSPALKSSESLPVVLHHAGKKAALKWEEVDASSLTGRKLKNQQLAEALKKKTEFTREEWEDFGIHDLETTDYIESGEKNFKFSEGKFDYCTLAPVWDTMFFHYFNKHRYRGKLEPTSSLGELSLVRQVDDDESLPTSLLLNPQQEYTVQHHPQLTTEPSTMMQPRRSINSVFPFIYKDKPLETFSLFYPIKGLGEFYDDESVVVYKFEDADATEMNYFERTRNADDAKYAKSFFKK